MSERGRFIVVEGGEASGKSTQAELLASAIGAELTREPGGTALGERVRAILLDPESTNVDPRAELMLMLAARAQHVAERILPTITLGHDLVCDRYSASTLAYQGSGRGLDEEAVASADALACQGIDADLVILLRVPLDEARARRGGPTDRIEREDEAFFLRVDESYLRLAKSNPKTWEVVTGSGTPAEVHGRVLEAFGRHFGDGVTVQ